MSEPTSPHPDREGAPERGPSPPDPLSPPPSQPSGRGGEGRQGRRPGRVRRFLVRPFVWGLVLLTSVLVGLYYLIGSRFVAQRFTTFAISQASDFFQRPVRVASLDYSLFPLEIEARGVVIPGPTAADAPWATAELLRIRIPWRYLRQRILRFDQVEAIHPTLFLEFRPDGTTNFPNFRIQGGNGQSRLQIQIGRLLVQRGEFHLNQRRVSFDLAARGVWGRMTGPRPNHLEGMATAQEVVTSLPDGKPYPVTASGKVTLLAQRGLLRIESARVSGPDLRASAHGWVGWQGPPRVEIQFDATGDARLVNHLGYLDAPLTGPFQATNGRFSLTGEEWSFSGAATAPRVDFLGRTATAVAGRAQGNGRRVHVDVDRATYAGGTAKGKVDVDLLTPTKAGRPVELAFDFRGVSLADALAAEKVPVQGLSGEGTGNFVYRFNSAAILGGSGKATVELAGRYPATGLPVSGTIPLVFERGKLTSQPFQLTAPGQNATASLEVDVPGESGKVDFQLASQDAGAVMRMIPVDPKAFWNVTAGHGQATGSVAYSKAGIGGMVIDLGLDLADVRTPDPAIVADTVKGGLRVEPRAVENLKLDLTQGRGKLSVQGRVPIPGDRPKVPLSDPLTLAVEAVDWPAESVVAFLSPGFPVAITGLATGRVDLGGSVESLQGTASGRVASLALQGFPLGQATAGVRFAGTAVQVENGVIEAPAGKAFVQGTFDTAAKTLDFQLEAPALSLAASPFREQLPGAVGAVAVMGGIRGSLDHPAAMLSAHGQGVSLAGRSLGDGGKVDLLADWDGATLHASGALPGLLTLSGGGRLDGKGADLAFDLKSDNLPGLARLAAQQPLPAFAGQLAGRVTAAADWSGSGGSGGGTYRAELTLPTLAAQYEGRTIANAEPVVVDWTPDRVTLRSFYLRENQTGTELVANGSVGLSGNRPLDLRLQSTIWAGWAKLFAPDLTVDGSVDVLATLRGTVKDPVVRGQAELKEARLIVPGFPSAFEKVTGEVFLEGDQIVLNRLSAEFANGVVRASGSMNLPEPGKPLSYRTSLSARGISLRYPEGFVNHGDADLTLTPSEGGGRQVRGTVTLDRIYYLEDVPVATLDLLKRLFQRSRLEATTTNGFLASTQVNLVLAGPGALRVHNNVADLHGDVNLVVRGSLARPVVLGSVQIDPGGKLLYADNEYRVERGQLTFDNAYKIDPVIDFLVRTRVRDFDIAVSLSGTLERLSTNFSSNGNLADLEILTLLATGQELSQEERLRALSTPPGQTTTAQQNVSAGTFLAGQAASAIGQRVGTLFGFDRFRINPIAAETGQSVGGVGVTVGKRLSKDVFVTYSTDPTASRQNVLQVEWRLANRVTLLLTQTTNKGYAVDARWEKRF